MTIPANPRPPRKSFGDPVESRRLRQRRLNRLDGAMAGALWVLTLLVYVPTLSSGFVSLDDFMYVVDNPAVRTPSFASIAKFFTEVLKPSTVDGYYQPLTMTSLMLDAGWAGDDGLRPLPYHLTNILLHGLNGVLVFCLIRRLNVGRVAATLTAALFLLHPVQVESVAWISQRKSLIATGFALWSILAYLQYGRTGRRRHLVICAAAVLLGGLAKPTVMPLPLTFVLLDIWPLRRPALRALPEKLVFLPIIAAMGYVSWVSQASTAMIAAPKVESVEFALKWIGLLSYNMTLYLGNLVWPVNLSPYRSIPTNLSFSNPAIVGSFLFCAVLAGILVRRFRERGPLLVGMMGFLILLSPALGGVHFAATCVGDRFLYLPMVFLLMPFAAWLEPYFSFETQGRARRASVMVSVLLATLTGLGLATRRQQEVWADSRNLWFHIHDRAPDLAKADYNCAVILLDEGDARGALDLMRAALPSEPDNADYLLVTGRACTRTDRVVEGRAYIEKALRLGLGNRQGLGLISMAETWAAVGRVEEAKRYIAAAEEEEWKNAMSIALVGDLALTLGGNCPGAIELLQQAVELAPDDYGVRYALAEGLRKCRRPLEALREYEIFMNLAKKAGVDVRQVESAVGHLRHSLGPAESEPGAMRAESAVEKPVDQDP